MADAVPLRSNSKLLKRKLGTLPEVADAFVNTKQDLANAGCADAAQSAPASDASSVLAASLPAEYADPEEAALWHDFQQKLSQLRKLKVQRLVASPQAAAHPEGTWSFRRELEGGGHLGHPSSFRWALAVGGHLRPALCACL